MKRSFVMKVVLLLCLGYLFIVSRPYTYQTKMDLQTFSSIPVIHHGRLKPLDTVARNGLLFIHGKQTLKSLDKRVSALEWFTVMISDSKQADEIPVFTIKDQAIQEFLGVSTQDTNYFSFSVLQPKFKTLIEQATTAEAIESKQRNHFQKNIITLKNKINLYIELKNTFYIETSDSAIEDYNAFLDLIPQVDKIIKLHKSTPIKGDRVFLQQMMTHVQKYQLMASLNSIKLVPPRHDSEAWSGIGETLMQTYKQKQAHPQLRDYLVLRDALKFKDVAAFNTTVRQLYQTAYKTGFQKVQYEVYFNHIKPFFQATLFYFIAFILVLISFMIKPDLFRKLAFQLLLVSFFVHTLGILSRIWIQGRPPVTNLYSSAIFVAWIAIILGIVLELSFPIAIATLVSATIGWVSLIIAHQLSLTGDTLEMMQAVLDSNFWLATHVVTITIGYAGSFMAGTLGLLYIGYQTIGTWPSKTRDMLYRSVYGIVCFALLFSFIGTVLGGIWADQSWGRFWGWDPKENGALMIVLWHAFLLHARMGGLVKKHGFLLLAVFSNIITAFSWFGVNLLGIGLHSYGFMEKGFYWLSLFCLGHIIIVSVYLLKESIRGRAKALK